MKIQFTPNFLIAFFSLPQISWLPFTNDNRTLQYNQG